MTVELEGLVIRYGRHVAVDGVTVSIPGGAVGLLGSNGAGKSSILKALLGLVVPVAGRMRILDLPGDAPAERIRARVGYMPERDGHLPGLSGFEMVSLLGRLSGLPARVAWRRAHEVLYLVGLEEQRYRPVAGYSAGMRQKIKLAQALVHDPQVLFLDEPTSGLDPDGRAEMLALVRQLAGELGKSVVLSTHILQDVEATCDAVIVLAAGRVVAQGALGQLTGTASVPGLQGLQARHYLLRVEPRDLRLPERLPAGGGELVLSGREPGRYRVEVDDAARLAGLFAAVAERGGEVRELVRERRSLEEVFFGALGDGERPAPAARRAEGGP